MKKSVAIRLYGARFETQLAQAVGISRQGFNLWPAELNRQESERIICALLRELKIDLDHALRLLHRETHTRLHGKVV